MGLSNSSIANPTFTPTVAGIYTFSLTVTDTGSLSSTDTVIITASYIGGGGSNIPTFTEWGMIFLVSFILLFGGYKIKKNLI